MRTSVIVAAHNEGEALANTVESCIDTAAALDCEIIIADDASSDGSVEKVRDLFPQIRLFRHEKRQGVSPTRALGAREARGDVFVFLDGHTKPEPGALFRLVVDVEETEGQAIITPAIAGLDIESWNTDLGQVGHGYRLELETLECGWLMPKDMLFTRQGPHEFFESPALMGAALAVGRQLYRKLWGFDPNMRFWGVEDLDFGLKCWLMGYRILHDPQAVIGHRFRTTFDTYEVPLDYVVMNHLRLARKNFTHTAWAHWLDEYREQHLGPLPGHPEGLWATAWRLFETGRESLDQERRYLLGHRPRDEFWYAERFGLPWPRINKGAAAQRLALATAPVGPSAAPLHRLTPSLAPSSFPPRTMLAPSAAPPRRALEIDPESITLLANQPWLFSTAGQVAGEVHWTAEGGTPTAGTGNVFTTKWSAIGVKNVVATNARGTSGAPVLVVLVNGILTPTEGFAGRDGTSFKVGQGIDLSFVTSPSRTAAELGGLRWSIVSGGGSLTGGEEDDGMGRYTAPKNPGPVKLVLSFTTGSQAGLIADTKDFDVVEA